jgi:outer membrane receptor for ferric coprogen and ferric-rhodotorulic acid
MATQTRKRNRRTWQKLLQPIKLNARKRADCVLREARCAAPPGAVRATLEQAVAVEIERMRALNESEEAIQAFQAATELHIALCDRAAPQRESSARTHDPSIAPHGDEIAPA